MSTPAPNAPGLLDEEALLAWTKFKRRNELERFLNVHGVLWWPGKGGQIVTTLDAINRAMQQRETSKGVWNFGQAA